MAMTAFELFGVLKLDKSDFDKGLKDADTKASSFGSSLSSGLATAAGIGIKAVGAATAAVGAFATSAVAVGSSFDQAMGGVAATAGKTVDELNETLGEVDTAYGHFSGTLRDFAMYMGQNTTFSATEAAQALNYMALAGYDTQQSMEMLPSVLSMAAAGGMELAKASDAITDIQSALGLEFERTGDMVNEFAKAAASGNTSVEQLSDAFLVVGGLARELNGGMITLSDGTQKEVDGVQELEIAFTAMANAGVKGSEAGTHMRNMLLKLSSPTDDGATAMEKLGVKVFDTEGKMRSLSDIFGDLSSAMAGNVTPAFTDFYNKFAEMTPEAIAKEFKKSADDFDYFGISVVDEEGKLKDFNAVLGEVQARFGEGLTQEAKIGAISDLFNTRDMASAEALLNAVDTQWDSLGEKITDAAGAADEMSKTKLDNLAGDIKLWNSALETAQITINDKLSPYMREFVQLGTTGLQDLVTAFSEGGLEGAMTSFGDTLSKGLDMVVQMLPDAINAGMQLLGALGQGIIDNLPTIVDAAVQIVVKLAEGLVQALPELGKGAVTLIQSLGESFAENQDAIFKVASDLFNLLVTGLVDSLPDMISFVTDLIVDMATWLTDPETLTPLIEGAVDIIMALANGLIEAIPTLIEAIPVIVQNIVTAIVDNLPMLVEAAISILGALAQAIIENLPLILAAAIQIMTSLGGGIIEALPTVLKAILGVLSEIIKTLIASFPKFVENGAKLVGAIIEGIVKTLGSIVKAAIGLVDEFIKGLTNGWSKIIQAGKDVVDKVRNGFSQKVQDAKNWGKDLIQNFIDGIVAKWHDLVNTVSNIASTISEYLGFSEPDKGPLSNFHTFAPDMMNLFVKGINDNKNKLENAVIDAFDFENLITAPSMGANATNEQYGNALSSNVIINVYGTVGQDINELAEIVSEKIDMATNRRKVAMGAG